MGGDDDDDGGRNAGQPGASKGYCTVQVHVCDRTLSVDMIDKPSSHTFNNEGSRKGHGMQKKSEPEGRHSMGAPGAFITRSARCPRP